MPKLTKSVVDAAQPRGSQFTLWCSELKGFGVFIHPSGRRTYFVDYRNAHNVRRRITIGRHGVVTAEQARRLALVALGEVAHGEDPADERFHRRKSMTVKELCERYLTAAEQGLILGAKVIVQRSPALSTRIGAASSGISFPFWAPSWSLTSLRPISIDSFARWPAAKPPKLKKRGSCAGSPWCAAAWVRPAARLVCSAASCPTRSRKARIAKRAGLGEVTPHTLRHSFASVAGDLGYTEPTIAALLGHAAGSVTSRYVHHLDSVLTAAADRVAHEILHMMTAKTERKAA